MLYIKKKKKKKKKKRGMGFFNLFLGTLFLICICFWLSIIFSSRVVFSIMCIHNIYRSCLFIHALYSSKSSLCS